MSEQEKQFVEIPQPPPYRPEDYQPKPSIDSDKEVLLPTYSQSQGYEEPSDTESTSSEELNQPVIGKPAGTCLDFTIFFLLCCFFGVVGFVFSVCFAFTTAAEGGALAGLGLAMVFKLVAFETYDTASYYDGTCEAYYSTTADEKEICIKRLFYLTRLLFWFIGLFGFLLLFKGMQRYVSSRRRANE